LMKKYGVTQRDSHRALIDTLTTVDFFNFLMSELETIRPDALEQIRKLTSKTSWFGGSVFNTLTPEKGSAKDPTKEKVTEPAQLAKGDSPIPTAAEQGEDNKQEQAQHWAPSTMERFLKGEKLLLESAGEPDWERLANAELTIAYSRRRRRDEIMKHAQRLGIPCAELKTPSWYLSPERLEKLLEQPVIPQDQAAFLIKMILWRDETTTGSREEITLGRNEYALFDLVADEDGSGKFAKNALEKAQNSHWVVVHQQTFSHGIALQTGATRKLIILDGEQLEENLTAAFRIRHTDTFLQRCYGDRGTLAGGLLGIFYQKMFRKQRAQGDAVMVGDNERSEIEWKQFIAALSNLPESNQQKKLLSDFAPQDDYLTYVSSFANELSYVSAPLFLGELFHRAVGEADGVIIHGVGLGSAGGFNLVRELYELDSEWGEIIEETAALPPEKRHLFVHSPTGFPEPNTSGYFESCRALFIKLIQEHGGRCLLLVNSKQSAQAFYKALVEPAGALGTRLLAFGQSGGVGKILSIFKEDPDHSVLIATNALVDHIDEIDHEIEVIAFQKIPFENMYDPLLRARSEQFKNGFAEYSLPKAVMRFRSILHRLGKDRPLPKEQKQKICFLLDSRVMSREYGKYFM